MKRYIIYHDDSDGRCAAAIAGRHAGSEDLGLIPVYIPVDHGDGLPAIDLKAAEYATDECWVLDFSWPLDTMDELLRMFCAVTWIDHHETAINELAALDAMLDGLRNTDMAACFLTWHHINGGILTPIPVRLIADRDTKSGNFGLDANYFHESFQTYQTHPKEEIWDRWLDVCELEQLRDDLDAGELLYNAKMTDYRRKVETYGWEEKYFGTSHKMLTVNLSGDGDLGELINRMGFDVAHCYIDEPTRKGMVRRHSLYSRSVDVGALAAQRGGGGHKHASGWVERIGRKNEKNEGDRTCVWTHPEASGSRWESENQCRMPPGAGCRDDSPEK